jgi:broad specificity phosphatase PhoE
MAKRLLLVRHALPVGAVPGRLLGSSDPPLDARGLAHARALAARVTRLRPECCYSSPLRRCRETAQAIAGPLPVMLDADLREIDFGRWENRTFADVAAAEPELVHRWAAYDPDFTFPGGEQLAAFRNRVREAAARLAADPAVTVLAVTHGGVIRALLCHYLGLAPQHYVSFEPGYGALAVLNLFDGRGTLEIDAEALRTEEPGHG